MSVQAKYQNVLTLGEALGVKDGVVKEENGVLTVAGVVETPYQKNLMWDAIKASGGSQPSDLIADIRVANTDFYAKHIVESGESLSKIAKHYYGDMMKYKQIFEANRDILDSADVIEVGQVLMIPNE
jgi:hypothetical protein